MGTNPLLSRLGLADTDRAVILHADDVGVCHASLAAYADLLDAGIISSAGTMVPSPWFPATAAFCRAQPAGRVDMGVHLTLNAEWPGYRWRPLTAVSPDSGLVDGEGYQPDSVEAVRSRADPADVWVEIDAQVGRALAAGIDVTHIDSHMGTIFHAKFLEPYIQVALKHRVPPLLVRANPAMLQEMGIEGPSTAMFAGLMDMLEAQGLPVLDSAVMLPLDQPDDRLGQVRRVLESLPIGVSYLLFHPAKDTPELRALAPDWRCRVADYEAFTNPALRQAISDSGIQVVGWRAIRDLKPR